MSYTIFCYTARGDDFNPNKVKYLTIFVNAGMNDAVKFVTKELGALPFHMGYEAVVGKNQRHAWRRACNSFMDGKYLDLLKILLLKKTARIYPDKRFGVGYRVSKGTK